MYLHGTQSSYKNTRWVALQDRSIYRQNNIAQSSQSRKLTDTHMQTTWEYTIQCDMIRDKYSLIDRLVYR